MHEESIAYIAHHNYPIQNHSVHLCFFLNRMGKKSYFCYQLLVLLCFFIDSSVCTIEGHTV
jgi:hypothetical protein